MFWSLFKSLVHAPCNNDEDKQRPQNFFYFYIATTPIKIRDITEESKKPIFWYEYSKSTGSLEIGNLKLMGNTKIPGLTSVAAGAKTKFLLLC